MSAFDDEVDYVKNLTDILTELKEGKYRSIIKISNIHRVNNIYLQCICTIINEETDRTTNAIHFPVSKYLQIKIMLVNHKIPVKVVDNRQDVSRSLDDLSWITELKGLGSLCYGGSEQCIHKIILEDRDGKEYTLDYIGKDKIKEICDYLCLTYPDHIIEHDNYYYMSDDEKRESEENDVEDNNSDCEHVKQICLYCLYEITRNDDKKPIKTLLFNDRNRESFQKACENFCLFKARVKHDSAEDLDCIYDWPSFEASYDDFVENDIVDCVEEDIDDAEQCVKSGCIIRNYYMGPNEYCVYTYQNDDRYDETKTSEWSLTHYVPSPSFGPVHSEATPNDPELLPRWYLELMYNEFKSLSQDKIIQETTALTNDELFLTANRWINKEQERQNELWERVERGEISATEAFEKVTGTMDLLEDEN